LPPGSLKTGKHRQVNSRHWTVIGRIPASILKGPSKKTLSCHSTGVENRSDADLVTVVQNFYATKTFGTSTAPLKMSVEDSLAFEMLVSSIHNVGMRFELCLPLKQQRKELPYNRASALQRLKSVGKRLLKDPKIAERYVTAIERCIRWPRPFVINIRAGRPKGKSVVFTTPLCHQPE